MRKIYLAVVSIAALAAFMGFSATSFGSVVDPSCDLGHDHGPADGPYNNDYAIHDFDMNMPTTDVAGKTSAVGASGVVCGTEMDFNGGNETLINHLDLKVARGVEVNDSDNMDVGQFISVATVNVILRLTPAPSTPFIFKDVPAILKVADKAECDQERETILASLPGSTPEGETILCWKAETAIVTNFNWQTRTADGTIWNTIGPINVIGPGAAGLTKLDQAICQFYGGVIAQPEYPGDCGVDPAEFNHKNGWASTKKKTDPFYCPRDAGLYTVTVTNNAGEVSDPATKRVNWKGGKDSPFGLLGTPVGCAPIPLTDTDTTSIPKPLPPPGSGPLRP